MKKLALALGFCVLSGAAFANCNPTPILDGGGVSTNTKSALDGSSNCFAFVGMVDSAGANIAPAAAALGDATANPTALSLGSLNSGWDATNTVWRRLQVDAGTGTLKADIGGGTLPVLATGSNLVGKVGIDQTTPGTTNGVQPLPGTSGGWTPKLLNAQGTSVTTVKGSAGKLGWYQCANLNSLVAYLQIFDISGAVTLGASTPALSIPIMPGSSQPANLGTYGMNFANAIKVAATTTATGSTAPATALDCNAGFN